MNIYIIYGLFFPNGKIRIGQTNNFDKRMYDYNWFATSEKAKKYLMYNYLISKKIRKYGWDNIKKEILYDNISEEFIDELETQIISKYNSADYNFGYNVLNEAKTMRGYKHTTESKKKISMANSGKNHSMWGKHHLEKTKEKIRIGNLGKKQSEKSKKKMSKIKQKPVIAFIKNSDKFIGTFESAKQASEKLNLWATSITAVLRNKYKSTGGYTFKYLNGNI